MKKGKFWTARYAAINATYFMAFCGMHAYASVFLLSRGFSNSQIGMLLAASNVLSVLIQPVVAGLIDKPGKLTNRNVSAACTAILIILSLTLTIIVNQKAVIFVVFLLIYMIQMAYQPIIIAMNFEYAQAGCNINFGLARGLGSAGFAVFSPVLGTLLGKYDVSIIHMGDALALTVGLFFLLTFKMPKKEDVTGDVSDTEASDIVGTGVSERDDVIGNVSNAKTLDINGSKFSERKDVIGNVSDREEGYFVENMAGKIDDTGEKELTAHNGFFDFMRHYPRFMVFLIAVICFFFGHNALNDYLIQIITPLGGLEKHMGYATAMAAILELPTMAMFAKLSKKVDCGNLLKISGILFTVKVFLMFLAKNIFGVFLSQFFQIGAYALFIPASAYYANKIMEQLDQVKGQAYVNCAVTLGGVFSGLVCGRVLDVAGPKTMLLICTAVAFIGALLCLFIVQKVDIDGME